MKPCSSDDKVQSSAHSEAAHSNRTEERNMKTPFPWRPMVAIAISIVTVMYTLCNLFPYAGYMVRHLGVTDDKDEAGKFASVRPGRVRLQNNECAIPGICDCCVVVSFPLPQQHRCALQHRLNLEYTRAKLMHDLYTELLYMPGICW